MEFEWDEAKRKLVLDKHGLDFRIVTGLFDGDFLIMEARSDFEPRKFAVGWVNEALVVAVFTERGSKIRLITARRARENERRAYRAVYS